MLVKDYMTRHPIMIEPHKKVLEAQQLMVDNGVHHLPVVGDGKRLLGLLTRSCMQIPPERLASLEVWEITRYLANLTVEKVMIKKDQSLVTINPEATLEDAADLMISRRIDGLPVIGEDEVVVGIITQADLLVELKELLGAWDPGWRIMVRIPARLGEYARLTGTISAQGWSIMAMGSVRTPKDNGYWDMVLKVSGCSEEELVAMVNAIEDHQLIDIRETNVSPQREPTPAG